MWLETQTNHVQVYLVNANKTDVLLLIGAIYYQMGNYEQCIAFNDRCILLDPHMAEAHANLANALQQLGNFDMAVIYYQVHSQVAISVSLSQLLVVCSILCFNTIQYNLYPMQLTLDLPFSKGFTVG